MLISQAMDVFRPRTHALALEPRILFDGGAASAADQQHHADPAQPAADAAAPAEAARPASTPQDTPAPAAPLPTLPAAPQPHQLVVIDSRIENREQLAAQLPADAQLLVVDTSTDGLAAITAALAQMGPVDSIQIFSHGASGQFTLGSRTLSSDNVGDTATLLAGWKAELSPGADIQIYGCNVGAGAAGQALVNEIAQITGADVGASSDDTGAASAGGNWTLEVRSGDVDKALALSAAALDGFDGLLADAQPTVVFSSPSPDVLLGDTFEFTATVTNPSPQIGYAPFLDIYLPATGRDGDDGVTFVGATYLGQALTATVVTFDASGNATHPLWRDANGNPVVVTAASVGMRPGDQMVVITIPYGSIATDQPSIPIVITAQLSELADTDLSDGAPDLGITARAGFEFGNDALNNPQQDPTLVGTVVSGFTVHPTVVTVDTTIDVVEGETVTGPNFPHDMTVVVTPAPGQTLHNVVITQSVPDNVLVTSITPGGDGVLTSITLHGGGVLTDPADIAQAFATGAFISAFTIEHGTLSGATNDTVHFYVPEFDADGAPVIDPATGNPVTITWGTTTASGEWTPLDPRDVEPPNTFVEVDTTEPGDSFIARSLSLHKEVEVLADIGTAGLTPGDTLQYELQMAISDYFAFGRDFFQNGRFLVSDTLGDGQTFTGTPTLELTVNGVTQTIPVVIVQQTLNADGTTTLVFDIAQSLADAIAGRTALEGDLAFDAVRQGATTAVLRYQAAVSQSYTPPAGNPHPEINEGDSVGNNATVAATLLQNPLTTNGQVQTDGSNAIDTVPTRSVDIELTSVNNAPPPDDGELSPGDLVTFTLSYDLVTGDYENFSLVVYLPPPLLDASGVAWSGGTDAGQWTLTAGNTNLGPVVSVTSGPGNSVVFNFGSYPTALTTGSRIELQFTMEVGDQPFGDHRALNVLAQSQQTTTLAHLPLVSSDVAVIASIAEPQLAIKQGVVSTTNGTVTGTTGTWALPNDTTNPSFTGSITDLAAIEGRVDGIDASDTVRLATAIENTGGGGAYDVVTSVTLPAGLSFVGGSLGSANLQVRRGDGTLLALDTDYSVSGNTITFLDPGAIGSLLPGRAGTAADASGENIVVITYDAVVSGSIEASRTLQSSATLSNYASVAGGTDFTPTDLVDTADQQVAAPSVIKVFADGTLDDGDSSAAHTTGADLVIGESMLYDIVVTLPEGVTQTLNLYDLIPAGLQLDTTFGNGGYQVITTVAGSAALGANFNGAVLVGALDSAGTGTLGADGVDARLVMSSASANGDNDTGNNSFVVRVRLVAGNVLANQAGATRANDAQLTYSDPDGDTANGSTALDRTVALAGSAPTITIREPTLTVTQAIPTDLGIGVDEGDPVEIDITIGNTSGIDAFDINFLDQIPIELSGLTLIGVTYSGGATGGGIGDFVLSGNQITTAALANIDIPNGGSLVLRFSGVANALVANQVSLNNQATVQWTSLDGSVGTTADPAGERTGADGVLNSGVLNDYRLQSNLQIPVAQAIRISRVGGLEDTAAPNPTNAPVEQVTIGEIIRYRVAVLVPEGSDPDNTQIRITLPAGLDFIDPVAFANAVRIAFVSQGGLTTDDANLIVDGTLEVTGNENSPEALYITPDLSGPAPQGVLNPANVSVSADGRTITFSLGNLINAENDADREGVVIEFDVRVANTLSNQTTSPLLGVTATEVVDGANRGTSATLSEQIVEPGYSGVDKRVTAFDPNPSGTTGTATLQLSFTNNGGSPAFDTQLVDGIPGGSGYVVDSIVINGAPYTPGTLPTGVTVSVTATGITANFDQLNAGDIVQVTYHVTLPNAAAIAVSNAVLSWTSLPDDFTDWGESTVGTAGTATGERTGTDGVLNSGVLNDYQLQEGAGLGVISGTLWNDTQSATTSTTPDGPGLGGLEVTLTWAGADGDLATTGDNATFTTTTDANGAFRFGILPAGSYRIDTPASTGTLFAQPIGELRVRIDTDGGALGQVVVALGEGQATQANIGYVEQNDAPVNNMPATGPSGDEDIALAVTGITVSDVDVDRGTAAGTMSITLSVTNGTLFLSSGSAAGVTVAGQNTGSMVLTGTLADLNAALTQLMYLGRQDFNGTDTLTVLTSDLGNFGDFDGNGTPGQASDARTDQDSLVITLAPVNDPPTANPDTAQAIEAGGTLNQDLGVDPSGGLLGNDTDVDIQTNGDVLTVIQAGFGATTVAVPGTGTATVTGSYGSLVVNAGGVFQYIVDNDNAAVEALRTYDQTLTETFTYTITDTGGLTSSSTLTVTLHGANDAPVGVDDAGTAIEAGGVANGTPGADATGNVLTNDTDVDTVANGEGRTVTGLRYIDQGTPGDVIPLPPRLPSIQAVGQYGTLEMFVDGSYVYRVDNANATVQALSPGQELTETFSYRVTDAAGLNDVANLVITIQGANDNPVASDDLAAATAGANDGTPAAVPATGNVITTASRPGTTDNGVDTDIDSADNPNTVLQVNGIRTGTEAAGGALGAVTGATNLAGLYGTLTINPDGSFTYNVDSSNATVQALPPGTTIDDVFTYSVVDTAGATDTAQLVVRITGVNDAPIAGTITVQAVEAGGLFNGTPGVDPSGDVHTVVSDPDNEVPTVTAVRSAEAGSVDVPVTGTSPTAITTSLGTFSILANGQFSFAVDNSSPLVEALRTDSDTLTLSFMFTVTDAGGKSAQGVATIVIHGRNDNPVAVDDTVAAVEAGGTFNAQPGVDPTGTAPGLLGNDTDVDAGDTRTLTGIRTGAEAAGGSFTAVGAGGQSLAGLYGTLTVRPDGSYDYVVDNTLAVVQALTPGQTLSEVFSYTMIDTAGAADIAQFAITITGAWDAPVAANDVALAVANNGRGLPFNPTRNVLPNDTDVDRPDQLRVSGIRAGEEAAGGTLATVATGTDNGTGTRVDGLYGWILIGSNGVFTYFVDTSNPVVQALGPTQVVHDYFTYQATDLGELSDLAEIHIIVRGVNDPPFANSDDAGAVEAGGLNNAQPGVDPQGNVLANDTDLEGDELVVTQIRTGSLADGTGTAGTVGTALRGQYGTLTLNADGSYTYVVDNSLPAVEALRASGQTLLDVFTYGIEDIYGAPATAELRVTIDGRNDTPIAHDVPTISIEAGGIANGTPGLDPTGNVLDNDNDVDGVGYGETRHVLTVTGPSGAPVAAGQAIAGQYGQLVLNTDGSYRYVLDNANPTVQALRTPDETLREVFTYRMVDTAGATSDAQLQVLIRGANDNPVAADDSNVAASDTPAPQANGHVLPNDTDVDGGDSLQVVAIRTGPEAGSGRAGAVGQAIAGQYGTLVLNADGSYTYTIDQTNPDVLAAAGLGRVLVDPFTYTVADRAGATDTAQLTISLDIAAPYIAPPEGPYFGTLGEQRPTDQPLPEIRPMIYVQPVVRQANTVLTLSSWGSDGSEFWWQMPGEIQSQSIGAGLGDVPGQYVTRAVEVSRVESQLDMAWIYGRENRINLSADGLLDTPSLFAPDAPGATPAPQPAGAPAARPTAQGFSEQLRDAALRLHPLGTAFEAEAGSMPL